MKKITLKIALLAAVMAVPSVVLADFSADRAAAVAAADKAKSVGGEWRDIRWKKSKAVKVAGKKMSFLKAADAYHKAGDDAKATKYLDLIKFQSKMGYEQAMGQKNAGPRH